MLTAIILLFLPLLSGAAEGASESAALAAPFENTAASARQAAMGGALLSSRDDASLLLVNPAVLADLDSQQISLHHNNWIADVLQETVVLALPHAGGGFGVTANYVNYGHFEGRDELGRLSRALGASDLGLGLGYARRLLPRLKAGFAFKSTQQTLAEATYTTYAADFGALFSLSKSLALAAAYDNLGTAVGGSQRSTVLRLGGTYEMRGKDDWSLSLSAAAGLRPLGLSRLNFGFEAGMSDTLYLRGGYSLALNGGGAEGLKDVTFGAGFQMPPLKVDYAYVPFGELGNVQRFSVAYLFNSRPAQAAASPRLEPVPGPAAQPPALPEPPRPVALEAPPPKPTPSAEAGEEGLEFVFKVKQAELGAARTLAGQGNYRDAVQAYSLALEEAPEDPQAWRELADIYFRVGKKDYALRCYEEVLRIRPDHPELRDWLEKYRSRME